MGQNLDEQFYRILQKCATHPGFANASLEEGSIKHLIVEEIDKKENSKEIYEGIWNKYLKPIFDIIKTDKDSKKALKDYKVMVRELSNKYLKGDK